jgi:hypothetical protein
MKTFLVTLALFAAAFIFQAANGCDAMAQAGQPAGPQASDDPAGDPEKKPFAIRGGDSGQAGPEGAAAPGGNAPEDPASGGDAPVTDPGVTSPDEAGTRGGTDPEGDPEGWKMPFFGVY